MGHAPRSFVHRPLFLFNALVIGIWLVILGAWIAVETAHYDASVQATRQQMQAKTTEVLHSAMEETLAAARLLREDRIIVDGLLVENFSRLVDTTLPMLQLPYVQWLTIYRPDGTTVVSAHDPASFGQKDALNPWIQSVLKTNDTAAFIVATLQGATYLLNGSRVTDYNGLIGYVVLGTRLDNAFAERLSRANGLRVSMSLHGARIGQAGADASADEARQTIDLPDALSRSGLDIALLAPTATLDAAHRQNLLLGLTTLLLAGGLILSAAAVSARSIVRSHQQLRVAHDAANEASQAKSALLTESLVQRRRLDLLVRCANIGSLEWIASSGTTEYSPHLQQMLGYPESADLARTPLETLIHPADRERVVAEFFAPMRTGHATQGHGSHQDFRFLHRDGHAIWVHGEALTLSDNLGMLEKFIASFIDISPMLAAASDTRAALLRQQQLNTLRAGFITMTSHEFRTPLAAIQSSTQLLKHYDERLSSTNKATILRTIEDGVDRMTKLLERVLYIGKGDARELQFQPTRIQLQPVCHAIVQRVVHAMPQAPAQLVEDYSADTIEGLYDENLLTHMLENLLSNALKYSPAGGEVHIQLRREASSTVLEVRDQGIGIPKEELPYLFDSFHRCSNVRDIPGTGLGLSIVKSSVELHGGQIAVQSTLGQGTTFTIRL